MPAMLDGERAVQSMHQGGLQYLIHAGRDTEWMKLFLENSYLGDSRRKGVLFLSAPLNTHGKKTLGFLVTQAI